MMSRPPIDRFSEEQTARVVRGSDAPDIEAGVSAIRQVLKTLPTRPGVYRMQDVRGDVLYVGKARALKYRVANYVQIARLPQRLQRMVADRKRAEQGKSGSVRVDLGGRGVVKKKKK